MATFGKTSDELDKVFQEISSALPGRYTEEDLKFLKAVAPGEGSNVADPTLLSKVDNGKWGHAAGPLQMIASTYARSATRLADVGIQVAPWEARDLKSQLLTSLEEARLARRTYPTEPDRQAAWWIGGPGTAANKDSWATRTDGLGTKVQAYVNRVAREAEARSGGIGVSSTDKVASELQKLQEKAGILQTASLGVGGAELDVARASAANAKEIAAKAGVILASLGLDDQNAAINRRANVLETLLREQEASSNVMRMYQDSPISGIVRGLAPQLIGDEEKRISAAAKAGQDVNQELAGIVQNAINAVKAKELGISQAPVVLAQGEVAKAKAEVASAKVGVDRQQVLVNEQQQNRQFDQQTKVADQRLANERERLDLAQQKQDLAELKVASPKDLDGVKTNLANLGYDASGLTVQDMKVISQKYPSIWIKLISKNPVLSRDEIPIFEQLVGARDSGVAASLKLLDSANVHMAITEKLATQAKATLAKDPAYATMSKTVKDEYDRKAQLAAATKVAEESANWQQVDKLNRPVKLNPYRIDSQWLLSDGAGANFAKIKDTPLGQVLVAEQARLNGSGSSANKTISDYDILVAASNLAQAGKMTAPEAVQAVVDYFAAGVSANNARFKFKQNGLAEQNKYILTPDVGGFWANIGARIAGPPDGITEGTTDTNAQSYNMLDRQDVVALLVKYKAYTIAEKAGK